LVPTDDKPVHVTPEFLAAACELQNEYHEQLLAHERVFEERMNAPLGRTQYANTNYWDKWGPAIDGWLYNNRREAAEAELDRNTLALDAEFAAKMQQLENTFFPEGIQ
jgi:hypothetical protein